MDDKIVENNENDMVKEIEEVFDEEEGKVDVENIDLMLDNDNFEEKHDLILDSVPENTELKTILSNINELTQICKDNNTNFLKDSVQNDPHESDNKKTIDSKKKKKINVKFEIRRGSYVSSYNAIAGNGNNDYFRNVTNIKDHVHTTNPLYTHKRQHVFHNDKELFDNCVLDEKLFFKNPRFIIEIDVNVDNLKSVSNDQEIYMDKTIYSVNDLLEQKCMVRPTLKSETEYVATINQIFEQDNSYVFQITYDGGKMPIFISIDLITLLFKKNSTERPKRKNVGKISRYVSEDFVNKKGKSKKKKINTRRQSSEKICSLVAKGDTDGAKKEVTADYIDLENNINKIAQSMKKAAFEAEQEVFALGKFENKDAVNKIYDHTKTVDYCEDEDKVKKDKLNEMVIYKKRQQKIKDRQEKIIIKEKMKDELKKKKLVEKENKEKKNYLIKKRSYN